MASSPSRSAPPWKSTSASATGARPSWSAFGGGLDFCVPPGARDAPSVRHSRTSPSRDSWRPRGNFFPGVRHVSSRWRPPSHCWWCWSCTPSSARPSWPRLRLSARRRRLRWSRLQCLCRSRSPSARRRFFPWLQTRRRRARVTASSGSRARLRRRSPWRGCMMLGPACPEMPSSRRRGSRVRPGSSDALKTSRSRRSRSR